MDVDTASHPRPCCTMQLLMFGPRLLRCAVSPEDNRPQFRSADNIQRPILIQVHSQQSGTSAGMIVDKLRFESRSPWGLGITNRLVPVENWRDQTDWDPDSPRYATNISFPTMKSGMPSPFMSA